MKKLSKRRQEIIDDLKLSKANSDMNASFVFGCDYNLALKMVEDGQIGKVKIHEDMLVSPNITLSPAYKFFIKVEEDDVV